MINVIVNGARGKMGQAVVAAVSEAEGMSVVAELDMGDSLTYAIQDTGATVVVDFTHPSSVKKNALEILSAGAYPVVGTTGLSEADLAEIDALARSKGLAAAVCPNFAIGAVLMMQAAAQIAKHMPQCEIIEFHHNNKADAPSGTAIKTAELIAESNPEINKELIDRTETHIVRETRGGKKANIPIHAVRLQGFVASQEVIFGGLGQTLTLRHDTINRESFMPGVVLCVRQIHGKSGLIYGLEKFLTGTV